MIDVSVYILLLVIALAAVLLNLMSLPGNWVILAAAAAMSFWHGGRNPHWVFLILILVILLAAEVVEFVGGMVGARAFGASKAAAWASIAGTLVGGLVGIPPLYAVMLGLDHVVMAIVGAFVAAWLVGLIKGESMKVALKGAVGAALGRGVGIVTKVGAGLLAWMVFAVSYWVSW